MKRFDPTRPLRPYLHVVIRHRLIAWQRQRRRWLKRQTDLPAVRAKLTSVRVNSAVDDLVNQLSLIEVKQCLDSRENLLLALLLDGATPYNIGIVYRWAGVRTNIRQLIWKLRKLLEVDDQGD
jgi:hypothetical protein